MLDMGIFMAFWWVWGLYRDSVVERISEEVIGAYDGMLVAVYLSSVIQWMSACNLTWVSLNGTKKTHWTLRQNRGFSSYVTYL